MKRVSHERRLAEGIDALARAADKASARGRDSAASYVLHKPSGALARDEVLIAVADATCVVLKLVKIPGKPVAAGRAANAQLEEVARRIAEIDLVATEIARAAGPAPAPPPPLTDQEEHVLRRLRDDAAETMELRVEGFHGLAGRGNFGYGLHGSIPL